MKDCCDTCYFYRDEKCKRFPPVVVSVFDLEYYEARQQYGGGSYTKPVYPKTEKTDWCGEHRNP